MSAHCGVVCLLSIVLASADNSLAEFSLNIITDKNVVNLDQKLQPNFRPNRMGILGDWHGGRWAVKRERFGPPDNFPLVFYPPRSLIIPFINSISFCCSLLPPISWKIWQEIINIALLRLEIYFTVWEPTELRMEEASIVSCRFKNNGRQSCSKH